MYEKRTITFNQWTFEIDQKLTKTLYSNIMWGRADSIPKNEFKHFVLQRDNIYPEEILKLFTSLGVDYRKELKLNHWVEDGNINCYEGCFYFVGELVNGCSCKIDLSDNNTVYELQAVNENFSIGFYPEEVEVFNHKLVYIIFSVALPKNIGQRAFSA